MITVDGWFDFAERMPGPPEKVWPDVNSRQGVVFHSAVGTLQGVINVVMGPVSNQRSVTGVVGYNGSFVQFYPITKSPWANGGHLPNRIFLGFEHEGGEDTPEKVHEPLTEEQIRVDVRILQDLASFDGKDVTSFRRPINSGDVGAYLWEHNEMTRFGAAPTACPSGRIPWQEIINRLSGGDMEQILKDELKERRNRLLLEHLMLNHYTLNENGDNLEFIKNNIVSGAIHIDSRPDWWGSLPEIQ